MNKSLEQIEAMTEATLAMAEAIKDGIIEINRELDRQLKEMDKS